jgi:hypothetical protein
MNPVVTPYQVQTVEAGLTAAKATPRPRTTLYDVMAALQTVVEPDRTIWWSPSWCTGDVPGVSPWSGT